MPGMSTFDNIKNALQIDYLPSMRVQINEEADPLYAQLEKSTRRTSGEKAVFYTRYGRSGGIGARADDGDLPTPNPRKGDQLEAITKNHFARLMLTEKAIKATEGNAAAWVDMLKQSVDDLLVDAKDYVSRIIYGDGTGKLATLAQAAAGATTLTLDNVIGLAEGMLIDVIGGGTGETLGTVLHAGLEILAVDDDANTIVVSSAVTAGTDDFIVRAGSYNQEMIGLKAIFTPNTVLYGKDRSQTAYKYLNPTILTVNGEISELKIQEGLDKAWRRTGVKHNFLVSSDGVRRSWQNLLTAQRQLTNTVELKGGYRAPSYDNNGNVLAFVTGKYAPKGYLHALSTENFQIAWLGDWEWMDREGSMFRAVANKAAYEATLQFYAELICDLPRGQVQWSGIIEH